jgi:hypothetical protein
LIELFCNQNRTGRLKIFYPRGPGLFYFQSGALVDAKLGVLNGVEAFYYALTLENAMFKFNSERLAQRRTIHQPWTHVALEGLRRIDEGEIPKEAYPEDDTSYLDDPEYNEDDAPEAADIAEAAKVAKEAKAASLSFRMMDESAAPERKRTMLFAGIGAAAVLGIAALGIPAGWYRSAPKPAPQPTVTAPSQPTPDVVTQTSTTPGLTTSTPVDQTALKPDAKKEADKKKDEDRKKAERDKKNETTTASTPATSKPEPPKPSGPKSVTVQVTYDESGRVTGAAGSDPAAVRIARQKRFPPGKAGTATVSIPVN